MHIHLHIHDDCETKQLLELIIKQNKSIMAKQEQFNVMIGRLNTTTNDLAASVIDIGEDYKKLLDEVKDTISPESLTAAEANITKVEEVASALKSIGAQVDNPVPVPPEEPPVE